MIDTKSYTIEWITDLRNKLGKRIDPKLIEKVVYALTLLVDTTVRMVPAISVGGCQLFRFKGCHFNFTLMIAVTVRFVPLLNQTDSLTELPSGTITVRFVPLGEIRDYLVVLPKYSDMANILDPMDLKQIITLHLDGASNRRIGSVLGISRNTVNTYMQLFAASDYSLEELLRFDTAALSELFSSLLGGCFYFSSGKTQTLYPKFLYALGQLDTMNLHQKKILYHHLTWLQTRNRAAGNSAFSIRRLNNKGKFNLYH